jgi:hypothetical protein
MTKTGWPPPVLMQDDNPQLSKWFATRPDALYTFKRNNMTTATTSIYYTYHTDPGHGWLEVGIDELILLGIGSKISEYSYINGGKAYLEEDCDMGLFIRTMEAKGVEVKLAHINEPTKDSVIRSYRRFP